LVVLLLLLRLNAKQQSVSIWYFVSTPAKDCCRHHLKSATKKRMWNGMCEIFYRVRNEMKEWVKVLHKPWPRKSKLRNVCDSRKAMDCINGGQRQREGMSSPEESSRLRPRGNANTEMEIKTPSHPSSISNQVSSLHPNRDHSNCFQHSHVHCVRSEHLFPNKSCLKKQDYSSSIEKEKNGKKRVSFELNTNEVFIVPSEDASRFSAIHYLTDMEKHVKMLFEEWIASYSKIKAGKNMTTEEAASETDIKIDTVPSPSLKQKETDSRAIISTFEMEQLLAIMQEILYTIDQIREMSGIGVSSYPRFLTTLKRAQLPWLFHQPKCYYEQFFQSRLGHFLEAATIRGLVLKSKIKSQNSKRRSKKEL